MYIGGIATKDIWLLIFGVAALNEISKDL